MLDWFLSNKNNTTHDNSYTQIDDSDRYFKIL